LASKAAAKTGLVLSSRPPQAESWCQSLRATTECEFDLAAEHPDRRTWLEPLDRNEKERSLMAI
jgi:hypothetical protein